MDTTDPDITFLDGVCNHCREFEQKKAVRLVSGPAAEAALQKIVSRIKADGQGKDYDCIAGVSGGVDSTYVVYLAKKLGLRPLAVHFDNGWNTELAVSNIERVLKTLGVDLHTFVVDWDEFKDLQRSFLKASTPDIEIPTDHAIYALLFEMARKAGVRYVLNGMNFASEGIAIPSWAYGHSDWRYIRSVHKQFGTVRLKTFPHYGLWTMFHSFVIRRLQFVSLLNYIHYDKSKAVELLQTELGWRPYSGKHHESIYTRFLQSYILPRKFNIDKRKAHLSNLIHSGSGGVTRESALQELQEPPCDPALMQSDKEFVIKKLGFSDVEFEQMMRAPTKSFRDYKNGAGLIRLLKRAQHGLRSMGLQYR
jgi:N-acetyl sugar amidotransferase